MKDKYKFFCSRTCTILLHPALRHEDYFRVMLDGGWGWGASRKVQCKVAEVVCAALCHIIERLSAEMLFLQDPLGSCKGNDSVIQSWSSFLELFDNPHERQRIPVINFGQQASLLSTFTARCQRVTTARRVPRETQASRQREKIYNSILI